MTSMGRAVLAVALGLLPIACAVVEGAPAAPAQVPAEPTPVPPKGADGPVAPHLVVIGTLVAFGNEPHVVWLIRALDGKLYYPKGKLQALVAKVPVGTYEWEGSIEPPMKPMPGIIPAHEAVFTTLTWRRVGE